MYPLSMQGAYDNVVGAEQLEVNRRVPYTLERERWLEVVAASDVSQIPLNAGYGSYVCTRSLPSKARLGGVDLSIRGGVCASLSNPCGVVSERNNWGCAPSGIECPSGAPAIITRRVDGLVVPLDPEKRFCHNVVASLSPHDSLVGQSVGSNCSGMLACASGTSTCLRSPSNLGFINPTLVPSRQSFIVDEPALNSKDMPSGILLDPEGLVVPVLQAGIESTSPNKLNRAGAFVTNDVPVDQYWV